MQFFIPLRIYLGLLNLSVFFHFNILFSIVFFTPRHPRFSVPDDYRSFCLLCYFVYQYLYKKEEFSTLVQHGIVVQIYKSHSLYFGIRTKH